MADLNIRDAIVEANIREMQRALRDPDVDVATHALNASLWIDGTEDGQAEIGLVFDKSLPAWIEQERSETERDEHLIISVGASMNPLAMCMRFRTYARATAWFRNPDTDEYEEHRLTPEQQQVLDEYASAGSFWLAGAGNGELLKAQEVSPDEFPDQPELGTPVTERIANRIRENLASAASECEKMAGLLDLRELDNAAGMIVNAGPQYRKAAERIRSIDAALSRVKHGRRHPRTDHRY